LGRAGARGWVDRKDVVTLDQAISYFTDVIRQNPNDHNAYRARGNAWFLKGQFDHAIEDDSEAIRLNPKIGGYHNDRGLVWDSKGEYEKAIADFNEALRLHPTFMQYFNRGLAFRRKEQYDRAIPDFDEAIRLAPKYTPAYRARGLAYQLTGQYERAIADYNEAIRINPAFAGSYASLAQLQATCPDDRYRDGKKASKTPSRPVNNPVGRPATLSMRSLRPMPRPAISRRLGNTRQRPSNSSTTRE